MPSVVDRHGLLMGTEAVRTSPYAMQRTGSEAEILLYGDIVKTRPKDYDGHYIEGNYIILSEFMQDLESVADVEKLTVRIHSAGGNAFDAITIHNRLKEMSAKVDVVVDGVAMSGGSIIMCAGDTVKVNPGSIIMIHKCWAFLFGGYNSTELRKMAETNDGIDRAQAAIYARKSGLDTETVLSMMENETYMTGEEALAKGFADELLDGAAPDIAASADRKTLFYQGQPVWATNGKPMPGNIPLRPGETPISTAAAVEINTTPKGDEGGTQMPNVEPLATANNTPDPVAAERARIKAIDEIAASIPDKAMVEDAKYINPCSAEALALRALQAQAKKGGDFLTGMQQDSAESNSSCVTTVAVDTNTGNREPSVQESAAAAVKDFFASKEVK